MESRSAEIVRRMYRDFDNGDLEAVVAAMTPDVVFHAPGGAPFSGRRVGRDQVLARFKEIRGLVRIDEFDIDEILADKDKVIALGRQRAMVRATGRHFEQEFAHVYTMRGDKVSAVHVFGDSYAVASAFDESTAEREAVTGPLGVTEPPYD